MTGNPTVAVLMGGPSAEHEVSLASGNAMQQAFEESGANTVRPIVISRDRAWLLNGKTVPARKALAGVDAALLALHGEWGEDGSVQALLEWLGIPYSGSGVFSSRLAMDKFRSRDAFQGAGLSVPFARTYAHPEYSVRLESLARLIVASSHLPAVVKPAGRGSSVGVSVVRHSSEMTDALTRAFAFDKQIVVEDHQNGIEVSCGVLDDGTGKILALPVTQILPPPGKSFFDYGAKYSGETRELVPAPLTKAVTACVQKTARAAHAALGCRHYSRTDMILVNGRPVVLEVNTLPGMTIESIFPRQAAAAGITFPELMARFVRLALRDKTGVRGGPKK